MRAKRAKEIKNKVLSAMYHEEDIKTKRKDILQEPQFKRTYRGAKKNYTRQSK